MTENEGISERIRNRRIELGLSQAQLSRDTGIAAPQLSRYESGSNEPRPDIAAKIANALKVSLEWLITGQGEKLTLPITLPTSSFDKEDEQKKHTLSEDHLIKLADLASAHGIDLAKQASVSLGKIIDLEHPDFSSKKILKMIELNREHIEENSDREGIIEHAELVKKFGQDRLISLAEQTSFFEEFVNKSKNDSDTIMNALSKLESFLEESKKQKE